MHEYVLTELSVRKPVEDVIFDSLQPVNVTQIIVQEYEPAVDYAGPIISLIDIYYDLSNLAKLSGTIVDIRFNLLTIETRLSCLHENFSRSFHCKFQHNHKNWWNSSFCFSLYHVCLVIMNRINILAIYKFNINVSYFSNSHNPNTSSTQDNKYTLEYYFDNCVQSAVLLTKICNSFIQLKSQMVPIYFLQIMIQSTAIHMISAMLSRSKNEIEKYNESMNRISINVIFFESYQGLQAHVPLVLGSLSKLKESLLSFNNQFNMQLAFEHVHNILDFEIPSIYAKDIDMYKDFECPQKELDLISQPNFHSSDTLANVSEIKMLNDLLNKFAL